jgi:hypothetical protein
MKKMLFVLVCAAVSVTTQAQLSVGAKGGVNFTSIVGDDVSGYKMKTGIHLGGYVNVPVTGPFSVQPELYFSTQGAKWKGGGTTQLSYLQIPVLAKFTSASGFFGETGPQLGFLMSAKDKSDGEKEDIKEFLKSSDFSWAFGAGYQVTDKVGAYARYNLSLSKLYDEEKNSMIQVGVKYTLFTAAK